MAEGSKAEERVCSTRLHRLVLRVPKATLDILGAYAEDLFRAIFGLELDCGKLWRSKSLGAGVNQPEDPWKGGERTASCVPARGPVARGPVGGERTASCVPARGPVGGESLDAPTVSLGQRCCKLQRRYAVCSIVAVCCL